MITLLKERKNTQSFCSRGARKCQLEGLEKRVVSKSLNSGIISTFEARAFVSLIGVFRKKGTLFKVVMYLEFAILLKSCPRHTKACAGDNSPSTRLVFEKVHKVIVPSWY